MKTKQQALLNFHQSLLEALRHREQEIFRYIAILFPALGGFVWLLYQYQNIDTNKAHPYAFVVGTIGVILLLFFGAAYSLALGYSFRQLTLQLAKLEKHLGILDSILVGWPREPKDFKYTLFITRNCRLNWCTPPEVIKVFWVAFLVIIAVVMGLAHYYLLKCLSSPCGSVFTLIIGGLCIVIGGFILPIHYGKKLSHRAGREGKMDNIRIGADELILWLRKNGRANNIGNQLLGGRISGIVSKLGGRIILEDARVHWEDVDTGRNIGEFNLPKTAAQYEISISMISELYQLLNAIL